MLDEWSRGKEALHTHTIFLVTPYNNVRQQAILFHEFYAKTVRRAGR